MTTTQPLTTERLTAIRARHDQAVHPDWRKDTDVGQLLAEVDRLRELLDERTCDIADKALENASLRAELAQYVGHEPTLREEKQELSRRLDAVEALLPTDPAEDINASWIKPRGLRAAIDGETDTAPTPTT